MSASEVPCSNQFFVTNQMFQQEWPEEASLSCQSVRPDWPALFPDQPSFKNDEFHAEQTTYNSGTKVSAETNDRRASNPMYSLYEDALIYRKVATAKNKLSAKKMVALQLGRTYSGIMNRYQILKSLAPIELASLLEKADEVQRAEESTRISAVIKKVVCPGVQHPSWHLIHFLSDGFKVVDPICPTAVPAALQSALPSKVKTESVLIEGRPKKIHKVKETKGESLSKKRGPYKTKHVRELEQVKGQGSRETTQFLKSLMMAGVKRGLFSCEELLERVFEKHHHSRRMIEMVLEAGQKSRQDAS